jgi:coenzyme F420-reducing hydrogenase alpha subunit
MTKDKVVKEAVDVLDALLSVDDGLEKEIFMSRFNATFVIKALDGATINGMQQQATFFTGKGKTKERNFNEEKFQALIIEKGCASPDWTDPRLKEKYKTCGTTAEIIQKRLLAGELAKLTNEVLELSGFYEDEEDLKN